MINIETKPKLFHGCTLLELKDQQVRNTLAIHCWFSVCIKCMLVCVWVSGNETDRTSLKL